MGLLPSGGAIQDDCGARGFDPERRVHLDVSQVKWKVLDKLMVHGLAFEAERNARRKRKRRAKGLRAS